MQSSETLLNLRSLAGGLLLGLIAWGAEGIGLHLILRSLDVDVSTSAALGVYAAGMLIGAVSFMTVAELYEGALQARWGPARMARLAQTLSGYTVIHSDKVLCQTWGDVRRARLILVAASMRPRPCMWSASGRRLSRDQAWNAATSPA